MSRWARRRSRYGHVNELADAVVMLARNGYITDQTINVNGGWYMS